MTKELQEKLKDLAALLTAVVALVATIKELREGLQGAGSEVWKNWPWYVGPGLLFLVILLWRRDRLVRWLVPRSTVLRRDAFHIGRKYLMGREGDVERLLHCLAEWPLVFLVGESGAGKSSLLERGVLPQLKKVPGQFPLLINCWGPDWIEGPREALAQALEQALDEPLRKLLAVEGPVSSGEAVAIVGRLRSKATRTPVLLFDQLDDYQTRHREKFLTDPERTLLSAEALTVANPFWREMADLLKSGGVRCLFTTRSDAKIGLESIRFQEPKAYPLDPLEKGAATDLLTDVAKDAIYHPERSFEQLRERLLDDLAADGWVLPIQMQVAFSGLADLRYLSVAEYERQGGLPGLEALHLETRISAAARAEGVSMADVRAVLLAMVDRGTRKTLPLPMEKLLKIFSGGNPAKLQNLLEKLEVDEVVRRRIDPGGEGSVWLLDHDYLSRGLLELDRRAQRWQLFLEESVRSYEGAKGVVNRWKKLLPPTVQLRLIYERLRGRLMYGRTTGYARLSTVKLLVWLFVPLGVWSGWNVLNAKKEAERLFAEFGQEELATGELRTLWDLSRKGSTIRHAFLDTAFAHGPNARRFNIRGDSAFHAAVGFRIEDRRYALKNLVGDSCLLKNPELDDSLMEACVQAVESFDAPESDVFNMYKSWLPMGLNLEILLYLKSHGHLGQELLPVISREALRVMKVNPADQVYISSVDGKFVDLLTPGDTRLLINSYMKTVRGERLGFALMPVGRSMTAKERQVIYDWALSSFEKTDSDYLAAHMFGVLSDDFPVDMSRKILNLILAKVSVSNSISILINSEGLLSVLGSAEARGKFGAFLVDRSSGMNFIFSLDALNPIIWRLDSSDALVLDLQILERIHLMESRWPGNASLLTHEELVGRLSATDRKAVLSAILEEIRVRGNAENMSHFIEFIGVLGDGYGKATGFKKMDGVAVQGGALLAKRLNAFGSIMPDPAVDEVIRRILEEMRGVADYDFDILCVSLAGFAAEMSDHQVRDAAAIISKRLEGYFPEELPMLLERLKTRLTLSEEQAMVKNVLAKMKENPSSMDHALLLLSSLDDRVSPEMFGLTLPQWMAYARPLSEPSCASVIPLIRDPKDYQVVDLLKWPTCSSESRDVLISRLDDLVQDATFGFKDANGEYHADIWGKFVPWAKSQGLDLESPPQLPDLDKLEVNN